MTVPEPLHPAKFSDAILQTAASYLYDYPWILDPFAGVGRVHRLRHLIKPVPEGFGLTLNNSTPQSSWEFIWELRGRTVGLEIEPEWAAAHPDTICTDMFVWLAGWRNAIPAVFTSPTYGNRFADHHNAKDPSTRRSYTHDMRTLTGDNNRDLHPNNSGTLQWGEEYRKFHKKAWRAVHRALKPNGGRFILNVKNHVRDKEIQPVAEFHIDYLTRVLRMELKAIEVIGQPGLRYGENRSARVDHEYLFVLDKRK